MSLQSHDFYLPWSTNRLIEHINVSLTRQFTSKYLSISAWVIIFISFSMYLRLTTIESPGASLDSTQKPWTAPLSSCGDILIIYLYRYAQRYNSHLYYLVFSQCYSLSTWFIGPVFDNPDTWLYIKYDNSLLSKFHNKRLIDQH